MKKAKNTFIYGFMLIFVATIFLLIIIEIPKIQRNLQQNVQNDMIQTVGSILHNFEKELHLISLRHPGKKLDEILKNDPALASTLEAQLSLLVSDDIKYIYVLYRDHNEKFRFMLDGSTQDKSPLGMKFDIEDNIWVKAYTVGQPQIIKQTDLSPLWITYLKPIVIDNKVQGIIATDFSLSSHQHILKIIQPLQTYLWIFLGFILLGGTISVFQFVLLRLSQKRVFIDPLTGIYNRNFLNDMIAEMDFHKYAVAMLDLDKFKIINDTYGHEAGDEVLRAVAATLQTSIREYDKLIRYGGEEFILFISMRNTGAEEVARIMERIRSNVEALSVPIGSITVNPTISIGLNPFTTHFKNEHDAISIADKMLYEAKRTGRNKVVTYSLSSLNNDSSNTLFNVHHVKEAIEEERLFCEYQPIVDLRTYQIVGYEALIRIRGTDGKTIYPGSFLPKIARSNIYKEMTNALLRMNFHKAHDEQRFISINLNITDILDDDIYQTILNHLENAGEEAGYFTFELLEEEQITNLELLKQRIARIRTFKAKISIDDFGSGYSNFSHIFALDIDVIKIDGSLIKNIDTSPISKKLVESIIAFADASGKRIVAEYIHSPQVLEIVKELGISYGQGFYLAKPQEKFAESVEIGNTAIMD